MVPGRESLGELVVVVGALVATVVLVGCESPEQRDNELRPPMPAGVSVSITDEATSVSPRAIGFRAPDPEPVLDGPEPSLKRTDGDHPQPVHLTVDNATNEMLRIVLAGPDRIVTEPVTARGTAAISAELETGSYTVRPAPWPESRAAALRVGPLRFSPQNYLALP